MKNIAAVIAALGAMLCAGGLVYGFLDVSTLDGTSCGSGFSSDSLASDTACPAVLSDRRAVATSLLVAGGTGIVLGAVVGASASNAEKDRLRRAATVEDR